MILLPFRFHSTDDSTPVLLAFYWWFYSHSTRILLMILLPFYSYSTGDSTPILLAFYWWFYSHSTRIIMMILLPFCARGLGVCPHSTENSTTILLEDLLPFFWWMYSHSTGILLIILLPFYGWFFHSNLLVILPGDSTPFQLIVHLFYWWFDPHCTDNNLLMILSPFYSNSTDHSADPVRSRLWFWTLVVRG